MPTFHLTTSLPQRRCQKASLEPCKAVMKFVFCSLALIASKPSDFRKFILSLCSLFPFSRQWCKKDLRKATVYDPPLSVSLHQEKIGSTWRWLKGAKAVLGIEHIYFKICKLEKLGETHSRLNTSSLKVYGFMHVSEYIKSHIQCSPIRKLKHKGAMTWLNLPFKFVVNKMMTPSISFLRHKKTTASLLLLVKHSKPFRHTSMNAHTIITLEPPRQSTRNSSREKDQKNLQNRKQSIV